MAAKNIVDAPRPGGVALVTGASAGIGECIAAELAKRGHELILVARRRPLLKELADKLADEHGVRCHVIPTDLAKATTRDKLPEKVDALGLEVDVLVNNAGFATGGRFHESDSDREIQQVRVLVEAIVGLTSAFLPPMIDRGFGAILNVASTAGMQPLPYSAGYSAAKAHARTFSEALHHEVKGNGVVVTALCPGPVKTDFWEVAGGDQPIEGAMPSVVWSTPEEVAEAGVKGLASGRRVVVPGVALSLGMQASHYIPEAFKGRVIERSMRPGKG